MKSKVLSFILIGLLFFIAGCDGTEAIDHTYVDSGLSIGSETLYYREYTDDTDCESFEVFPIYNDDDQYVYLESYTSMSDACSSSLYVETNEGYIGVYYAFNTGVYDSMQFETLSQSFTTFYVSYIVPSEVTLAGIQAEMLELDKNEVLADAIAIQNAAILYCAQTTCNSVEEFEWADLSPYLNNIDTSNYQFSIDGGTIAVYGASGVQVYLERTGTGDWEFPAGNVPNETDTSEIVEDTN